MDGEFETREEDLAKMQESMVRVQAKGEAGAVEVQQRMGVVVLVLGMWAGFWSAIVQMWSVRRGTSVVAVTGEGGTVQVQG